MKKLILLVLLAGCAQQPPQPSEAQLALLSYYADMCKRQGVNVDDEATLKGCILRNYQIDVASGIYGHQNNLGDVVQGLGSVYSAGAIRQTQCESRPDYLGGFVTTCR